MSKRQTTETLEPLSGPTCVNKGRARLWRSDDTKVDATRKITLYQRTENPQEAISTSILHDLRNPLSTICAGAELLMDLDIPSTRLKRLAAKMCHAAGRMRKLLADLPSITRDKVSSAEVCDIREVIAEIEQQGATEMLNEPRVQVRLKKDRTGVSRFERHKRATRITALSPRSESRQEGVNAVEWLSTSILHDLRNPLGAIYAAAEILIDLDPATTQVQRLATNIFRAAGRMQELLADLNSVALGNTPTPEICDIREVIAAASNAAWPAADNRRVQIVIEVPEGIELPLIRPRMQSVFFNLIANALEAMPTGGRLHIAAREAGSCVRIEMEDTGPGIPHEIRDKVFEPFVTAGKENGVGLGLAISRQAVLDHGGDIWIEPAAGARFVVRFPLTGGKGSWRELSE